MSNSHSAKIFEERLIKLEKKNNRLSSAVVIVSLVFCLILLTGARNKTFYADELKCRLLRADRILLIDDTLGTEYELDGNGWMITGKVFRTSGSESGVVSSMSTGKDSYVSTEYGNHGFRMSAWDGKHKTFIARLGDTYPSGNGLGALEIFDSKGKAYFSVVNGKVIKEELSSIEVEENAARHKEMADKQRAAIKHIINELQKERKNE